MALPRRPDQVTDETALLRALLAEAPALALDQPLRRAVRLRVVVPEVATDRTDRSLMWAIMLTATLGLVLVGFWLLNGPVYDLFFAPPPPIRPAQRAALTAVAQPSAASPAVAAAQMVAARAATPLAIADGATLSRAALAAQRQAEATLALPEATAPQPTESLATALELAAVPPEARIVAGAGTASEQEVALTAEEVAALVPLWIAIPAIGVDAPVIQVWIENDAWNPIDYAAGYLRGTGDLGRQGNVVIAAHAGLRGGVFMRLPSLKPGDEVQIETDVLRYRYVVREQRVVWPDQVEVLYATPTATLTLIACTNWDTQRLVVTADFVDVAPLFP